MEIPYTTDRRLDTGVTNVTMGVWLFIASEVMLFGALFSSYVLLRVSAVDWPTGRDVLNLAFGLGNTFVLALVTGCATRARNRAPAGVGRWLTVSAVFGIAFLAVKCLEWAEELARGLRPADSTFLAMYFTLTGFHAAHVLGGAAANLWVAASAGRVSDAMLAGRAKGLAIYWLFVDVVWLMILVLLYLT
jgi:heme/copper-type cytochrome/quinol oxidase subunit 3